MGLTKIWYIELCLQCQLKRLVRVKTKNPMIITDTPGTAFEKILMDIVGKLAITSSQNQYILTIHNLLVCGPSDKIVHMCPSTYIT